MWHAKRLARAFALYEVLLGLAIFSVGVLVLGRSVQNCLNASTLSLEEDRVRQILSNRIRQTVEGGRNILLILGFGLERRGVHVL